MNINQINAYKEKAKAELEKLQAKLKENQPKYKEGRANYRLDTNNNNDEEIDDKLTTAKFKLNKLLKVSEEKWNEVKNDWEDTLNDVKTTIKKSD